MAVDTRRPHRADRDLVLGGGAGQRQPPHAGTGQQRRAKQPGTPRPPQGSPVGEIRLRSPALVQLAGAQEATALALLTELVGAACRPDGSAA